MKPGTKVKLSKEYKAKYRRSEHVREFKDCIGIVEGLVEWPNSGPGPEVDVFWQPSNLRYAYLPEHLEVVEE